MCMAHLQPPLWRTGPENPQAPRDPSNSLPQPGRDEERDHSLPLPQQFPLLPASHSPIEHLKDNGYLVVHPEHPNLAETAEESNKSCFVS